MAATQIMTVPVWAFMAGTSGEQIETLAVFDGANGSNPGNIIQGAHGDFFGSTYAGGTYDKGTIFEIPLNKQVHTLVNFDGANGASPDSHIVQAPDGTYYGTTREGGAYNKGTVFSFTPSAFHTLISFSGANGDTPAAGLLRGADGRFYGTTSAGGVFGKGTVFAITPTGSLQTIASFNGTDGSGPGPLFRGQDGYVYGCTASGGTANMGVIYRIGGSPVAGNGSAANFIDPKDMTAYGATPSDPGATSPLHDARYMPGDPADPADPASHRAMADPGSAINVIHNFTGADGANPYARLTQLEDGTFYGTTTNGGTDNLGTVFAFNTARNSADPINFRTILVFNGTNGSHPSSALVPWSNGYFYMERLWDNAWIQASMPQWSGATLSGTTSGGGSEGHGTAFQVTPDGALTTLLTFDGSQGRVMGTIPNSLTPGDDGDLYGTTYYGGPNNGGTVFRILLQHVTPISGAGIGRTPPGSPGANVPPPPQSPMSR